MADTARSLLGSPAHSQVSKVSTKEAGSRQSGKIAFPSSARSRKSILSTGSEESNPNNNPFKMPDDNDIFKLRDKERQRKKQERIRQRGLKVHEKTTYATRVNFKGVGMIHPEGSDDDEDRASEDDGKAVAVRDDPQFVLAVTKDRHVEKESLADYINKKREMFLVQYSLVVKRDEMRKLEEIASAEERKLELAEQYLEEDAAMFDEFLKENDKNSVEAIKIAEAETKAKLEKVAEIKKINAQMMGIKSEISKYEDTLKEYQLYKNFLEALSPKEWIDDKKKKKEARKQKRMKTKMTVSHVKISGSEESQMRQQKGIQPIRTPKKTHRNTTSSTSKSKLVEKDETVPQIDDSDSESDEEEELFFTDPQQLLDIFAELEEQNLSLIQNSQETEEALEEMKHSIKNTKSKMEKETQILKEQIDKLNNAIQREEERAKDLEMKSRLFSYGEFKAEAQEKMLGSLNKKVEEVYRSCIGDNEANINFSTAMGTLQMLTNIENRIEELFEMMEQMPSEKVEAAEKMKEKERRLKQREEKLEQQRLHQEERVRKALERAKAEPKKKTGRKLVGRSEPPQQKKTEDDDLDQQTREEEELAYFFTP